MELLSSSQNYSADVLRDSLLSRQRLNPNYSIRAYARDLGLNSSSLSQILNGKRTIPQKRSKLIAKKLNLDEKSTTLFIESVNRSTTSLDDIKIAPLDRRFMLDESYFRVIAEWEHFAVLDLFDLKDFEPTPEYMCRKLRIQSERLETVLETLKACGLLRETSTGGLTRAHPDIRTTEDMRGEALNAAHLEELELAKEKLLTVDKEMRDFSSSTFAVDPEKITEAKTIIREFRQKMNALLKTGEKEDVYLLAIQFFPLSDVEPKRAP